MTNYQALVSKRSGLGSERFDFDPGTEAEEVGGEDLVAFREATEDLDLAGSSDPDLDVTEFGFAILHDVDALALRGRDDCLAGNGETVLDGVQTEGDFSEATR